VTITGWRKNSHSNGADMCIEVGSWRKSSRSTYNGSCVEAGTWKTSSACEGGACLEAASCTCGVAVRDTMNREGPVLTFGARTWTRFVADLKADA
jgi:hypothetical protein